MKEIQITTNIKAVNYEELDETERLLIDEARKATLRAYSPYSKFSVGAAILLDNGVVITGANQENVAFPSGTCAERTACFYAHAQHPDAKFSAIAIAAKDSSGNEPPYPISPCGSCRQALLEYETLAKSDIRLILAGQNDIYILPSVKSLLPLAFTDF